MNQLIKKLVLILLINSATNLWSTTYYFVGSAGSSASPSDGSNLNNWNTNFRATPTTSTGKPTTADLLVLGNILSTNGAKYIDIGGLIIGQLSLQNTVVNTTGNFVIGSGKTLTIRSKTPPSLIASLAVGASTADCTFNLNNSNTTIKYDYTSSVDAQEILSLDFHANVIFENSDKYISNMVGFEISESLTENSSKKITIDYGLKLSSSASLSAQNGTTFSLNYTYEYNSAPYVYISDLRTTKTYPGIWDFKDATWTGALNGGTYYSVVLSESCELIGNTKITNSLNFPFSNKTLAINSNTLILESTITNSNNGKFIAGNTSNLTCSTATSTIYFDQTSSNNQIKNLTITNGATTTIGNSLLITGGADYGTLTVDTLSTCSTGNNLTLLSSSGGNARIGKSSGTISGEYTVEQYIPADRDYRYLASPVVNGTVYQWRDNGNTTTARGIHITGVDPWKNFFDSSISKKPTAFYYAEDTAGDVTTIYNTGTASDDPGWKPFWNGNTFKLINGKGYRVFVRGDRTLSLTSSGVTANNTTIWTKGTYPGYSVTVNVANSNRGKSNDGMNFVGNPYPSNIDWNSITRTNVDNGYLVYKNSNSSFVGWNGTTGSAGQNISANQGFFVFCTNTGGTGSLTIHERTKTNSSGGSFFQQKLTNHLKINLLYDSSYNSDTYLHFREDAKNIRDEWDVPQMVNNGTNVATIDDANIAYNINSMGSLDSFKSVPLSVQGTPAANLKLSFFDVGSFPNYRIELVDTYKKTTTPLSEALIYPFEITSDSFSYKNGRFYLNFTKVEMMSSKVIKAEKIATISPNPIEDNKINIILAEKYNTAEYQINNILGQTLATGSLNKTNSIDAKSFINGVYFIKINSLGTSQTIQFIK